MITLLALGVAAAVGVRLFVAAVRTERDGRGITIAVVILALTIVEAVLWQNQSEVPAGLFHPGSGALSFRVVDVAIPFALAARLVAHGRPRAVGLTSLWWITFGLWLLAEGVNGVFLGNDSTEVLFQAKAVIYVVGAYALAAGIPVTDWLGRDGIRRLFTPAAAVAAVMIVLTQTGRTFHLPVPGMTADRAFELGGDPGSLFLALGVIALVLALTQRHGRLGLLLAAAPLLASTTASGQRAVLVSLSLSLVVVAAATLSVRARQRFHTTPTEIALTAMAAVGLVVAAAILPAAVSERAPVAPLASQFQEFSTTGKKQSAQARVNQWREARRLIVEQPVFGWGLGKSYRYFLPGPNEITEIQLTHNIGGDLLLRTGLVGLGIFSAALLLSLRDGWATWRYSDNDVVAAFALALVAVVLGLVGKGMVESLFEKYRLATLLGLSLGMLRAASTARRTVTDLPAETPAWS